MAQTCVGIPTLTTETVSTAHSSFTTMSVSTSIAPGSSSATVIQTCIASGSGNETSTSCLEATSYITYPGSTAIISVPVTVVSDYLVTNAVILSGSSCESIPPSTIPSSTPTTPSSTAITSTTTTPSPTTTTPSPTTTTPSLTTTTPSPTTTTPSPTTTTPTTTTTRPTPAPTPIPTHTSTSTFIMTSVSTSWSLSTPSPTTFTSISIVITGGSTYTALTTLTSTAAPTSVPVNVTVFPDQNSGSGPKKSNKIGPIVGGALGGLIVLLLLGFITLRLIKRHALDDFIFNTDHGHDQITSDSEPKSYDYNPVNPQGMGATVMSPLQPPLQGFNGIGPQPSQPHHHRTLSQVPLLSAAGLADAGTGTASGFIVSQPSSSVSRPIGSMDTQAAQVLAQGYVPTSYPPALQNFAANLGAVQSAGAANTQTGSNAPGFASGSGQATGSVPNSSLVPNTNAVSMGTDPSTYTSSSWAGSTGQYQPPINPIIGGPVQQQPHEDRSNHTGSPVSIHDQQILQIANPESSYPRGIYDPNEYYSSSSAGPSSAGGSSQAASSSRPRDGKGRRLVVVGNRAPVVHLDGREYEERQPEPERDSVVQTDQAPPAYSE